MKKIIYSIILVFSLISFSGCEDITTQDTSRLTYYVVLTLTGDESFYLAKGTNYAEPGYTAILKGADVTSSVKVDGTVDNTTPGIYPISYSAVNKDGFETTVNRTVYVYDTTATVLPSATYTVSKSSYRVYKGVTANFGSEYPVAVFQTSPGVFYITDFLAGWYDKGVAYGSAYAMTGTFKLNADSTLTLIDSNIEGWGDSLTDFSDAKFNPATNTITYTAVYVSGMTFYVTLTKQ
ncbi:MAG: DUF5012 domain-containing protein [Bacteroidota bacterium]|nr:DUF5012 domain-containing protein [Bacteroidota bacterium]